ncbi:hypothetical protein [Polaribacter vadi]|uniref:Uncharacterized protein n=1 Tax=Polaribacter vadi TaxID=1774273 RepID=A0A1B8U2D4_9FLAO|nr:hypothetical protein [Polaribacter vadi]OBY65981.1 hypothetical protein LPB3_02125 [Polaribacter vadi]
MEKQEQIIATDIETQIWYSIIKSLKKDKWKITAEYNQFDKGIDFDLYELKKNEEKILFAWDNWLEGEIKCSKERITILENDFGIKFKFGEPEHLTVNIIEKFNTLLTKK